MIDYLLKVAIIDLLLFAAYKALLRKETNLTLRRTFLLGATGLAVLLPFISIPVRTYVAPFDISSSISTIVLPEFTLQSTVQEQSMLTGLAWYYYVFILVSILVTIRLLMSIGRIITFYRNSEADEIHGTKIRHLSGLDAVFTFLNLIFLDRDRLVDSSAILKHEEAHVRFGHSYDLIFLNLMSVIFWWIPSIWAKLYEIKDIHEFQADEYAAKSTTQANYKRTIINYTLMNHGIILANSFNDTDLTKRLKFMKQLKRKVSNWKIASLLIMITLTVYTFSCQEAVNNEIEGEANQITGEVYEKAEVMPDFPGGMTEYYSYIADNISYPDKAKQAGISGKVYVEMIISDKGKVSNVKVLKGVGYGLDEEATRVVKSSPDWIAGQLDGKAVNVKMVLPIAFKVGDDNTAAGVASKNEMPTFPGGKTALFEYLQTNIKYPEKAHEDGLEGQVFVEFMIDTDGSVKNATVKRGFNPACDAEALRVIESLPNWEPVTKEGKPAATTMVLPITFKLK